MLTSFVFCFRSMLFYCFDFCLHSNSFFLSTHSNARILHNLTFVFVFLYFILFTVLPLISSAFRHALDLLATKVRTVHGKQKPYICEQCQEGFKTNDALKTHTSARHDERRPYSCPHCSLKFNNDSQFYNHIAAKHSKTSRLAKP